MTCRFFGRRPLRAIRGPCSGREVGPRGEIARQKFDFLFCRFLARCLDPKMPADAYILVRNMLGYCLVGPIKNIRGSVGAKRLWSVLGQIKVFLGDLLMV